VKEADEETDWQEGKSATIW